MAAFSHHVVDRCDVCPLHLFLFLKGIDGARNLPVTAGASAGVQAARLCLTPVARTGEHAKILAHPHFFSFLLSIR